MKSLVLNFKKNLDSLSENAAVQKLTLNLIYFACGVLASNAAIFGDYIPFGCSLIATVPYQSISWALLGALGGVVISNIEMGFRYICALLATFAIRWVLSEITILNKKYLFSALVSSIPLFTTGIIVCFTYGFRTQSIINIIAEALLSAVGSYFFARTISIISGKHGLYGFTQQELACISMSGCILLLSLNVFSIDGFSLNRIAAILIILLSSKFAGIAGGSVAGITTGFIFGLSSPELTYLSGTYAFGGLISGLFYKTEKIGISLAFFLSTTIILLQSNQIELAFKTMIEIFISLAIFIIIPNSIEIKFASLFYQPENHSKSAELRKSVTSRLEFASKAISDVSESVEQVSKKLKDIYKSEESSIFKRAINDVCINCGLKVYCWEKEGEYYESDFDEITKILSQNNKINSKETEKYFPRKCCRYNEMSAAITTNFQLKSAYSLGERQLDQFRGVVSEEFNCLAEILNDLSKEFESFEYYDDEIADKISSIFKLEGLVPVDTICKIDKYNRMKVEVILNDNEKRTFKKAELVKTISQACGRKLDTPCVSYTPDRCRLQFSERANYDLQIGTCQHISDGARLCGDSLNYFCDGSGRMVVVISDGMGTGGKAAIDANMTTAILTKLVQSGLSFDCSLKIVNSALLVKSNRESLATLDISVFDMYDGKTEFLKAGAVVSYIKKGNKVIKVDIPSLPIGILNETSFAKKIIDLEEDDWVVMVSDGMISMGDKWLVSKISKLKDNDPKVFADEIVKDASDRRTGDRDDDITAVVMRVKTDFLNNAA